MIRRDVIVEPGDPNSAEARAVLEAHLSFAHGNSPPHAVHAMDVSGLMAPDVSFFCVRDDADALVVVGALRHLSAEHGEIKSMHTAAAHRGRGYARAMLDHLLAVARERGYRQVSLETGSPEAFAPARALYAAAGFERCGPFGDYPDNGFSTFMTMELSGESSPLPKSIGAPATRALTGAGYISLESLAGVTEKDLAKLHGVGPKALRILKEELAAKGLSLG